MVFVDPKTEKCIFFDPDTEEYNFVDPETELEWQFLLIWKQILSEGFVDSKTGDRWQYAVVMEVWKYNGQSRILKFSRKLLLTLWCKTQNSMLHQEWRHMEANVLIHFTQGDDQEKTKFLYPKGIHLSSPTAVYSDDHPQLHRNTYFFIPWACVRSGPLQDIQMTTPSCIITHFTR